MVKPGRERKRSQISPEVYLLRGLTTFGDGFRGNGNLGFTHTRYFCLVSWVFRPLLTCGLLQSGRHFFADQVVAEALSQEMVVEFLEVVAGLGLAFQPEAFFDSRVYQIRFRQFFERGGDGRIDDIFVELLLRHRPTQAMFALGLLAEL